MALPYLIGEDIVSGSLGHFFLFSQLISSLCLSVCETPISGSLDLVFREDG